MKSHPIRVLAAGALAAVTAVGLLGCSPGSSDPDEPTSISIAIPTANFFTTWDYPSSPSVFYLTQRLVYEPLIVWDDASEELAPWLAEAWDVSEDGLTITFTIRQGVVFADGTTMDAAAVAKTLNAAYPGPEAYLVPDWGPVITVTGDYTLEVTTLKPITEESVFMLRFAVLPIMSPAAIDDPASVADAPNGTGPYVLTDLVPEVSATYERAPDYWNPDSVEFDEIELIAMADKIAALNALKSGQIDAAEIDASLAAEAEASGLTVDAAVGGFDGLFFLDRIGAANPALKDVRVRQALSFALDRVAILGELLRGYGSTSTQPFNPGSPEYVDGGDDRYAYDPERARELLTEAGYPDGLTIEVPRQGFGTIDYNPALEQYFGDIGVTIEWIETADASETFGLAMSAEVDAVVVNLPLSFVVGSYTDRNWWLNQPIDDPEHNEIIERYSGAPADHDEALDDYGNYILEQAWYLVIAQPENVWAASSNVQLDVSGGLLGSALPRISWFTAPE